MLTHPARQIGPDAMYYPDRLTHLCVRYRAFDMISAEDIRNCFDPNQPEAEFDPSTACLNFAFKLSTCLTC